MKNKNKTLKDWVDGVNGQLTLLENVMKIGSIVVIVLIVLSLLDK